MPVYCRARNIPDDIKHTAFGRVRVPGEQRFPIVLPAFGCHCRPEDEVLLRCRNRMTLAQKLA